MARIDGLGELLSSFTNRGLQFGEAKRRNDYQAAMEQQWLAQQAQAEKARQDRLREIEEDRTFRVQREDLEWTRRGEEREKDRAHERGLESERVKTQMGMVDSWIDTQNWDSPAQREQARRLGYAAVRAKATNPISVLDDAAGRIKPVDPEVAARRDLLNLQTQGLIDERNERMRGQDLAKRFARAGEMMTRYGVEPSIRGLTGFARTNRSLFDGFTEEELAAGAARFMGSRSNAGAFGSEAGQNRIPTLDEIIQQIEQEEPGLSDEELAAKVKERQLSYYNRK